MREDDRSGWDELVKGTGFRTDLGQRISHQSACLIEIYRVLAEIRELLILAVDSQTEHKNPSVEEHQTTDPLDQDASQTQPTNPEQ